LTIVTFARQPRVPCGHPPMPIAAAASDLAAHGEGSSAPTLPEGPASLPGAAMDGRRIVRRIRADAVGIEDATAIEGGAG
jgi:hypothetical protein